MTRRHSHSSKHMRLWRESVIVQIQAVSPQSWGSALDCTPSLSSLSSNLWSTVPKRGRRGGARAALEPAPGARTWSPHLPQGPSPGRLCACHLPSPFPFAGSYTRLRMLPRVHCPPARLLASSVGSPRHPRPRVLAVTHAGGTCGCWEPLPARGALTVHGGEPGSAPLALHAGSSQTGSASACRRCGACPRSPRLRWRATSPGHPAPSFPGVWGCGAEVAPERAAPAAGGERERARE